MQQVFHQYAIFRSIVCFVISEHNQKRNEYQLIRPQKGKWGQIYSWQRIVRKSAQTRKLLAAGAVACYPVTFAQTGSYAF